MPDRWLNTRLGSLLSLQYGKALPERKRDGTGCPVFGSNGVVGHHSKPLVQGPGIVVGRKGTAGSVTWTRDDFFPIDTTYWVRPLDSESLDLRFASLLLEQADLPSVCAQTGVPGLNRDRAYDIEVLVPPFPDQRRIVDIVGALDAQIESLDLEGSHQDSLLTALREALVDTVTWGPVRTMVARDGVQIGPFGAQLHAHDYTDDGVPVVMPQDIIDGEISTAKIKRVPKVMAESLARYRLLAGDLVLPRRGDLTKRALVGPEQRGWLCGTGSIRIRLSDPTLAPALLEGLSTWRTDDWLTTNAVGTTMLNLNTEIVSKLPAPIFSTNDRDLAEACVSTSRAIKEIRTESDSLRVVRRAVLSALLSGEVEISESYDVLLEAL